MNGRTLLIYSDDAGEGGVAHYNHILLLALARAGWHAVNAQPKCDSPLIEEQRFRGVEHTWLSYSPSQQFTRSFTDTDDPTRIMSIVQPDLIWFSDCCALSNIAAKYVAHSRHIPYVVTCHSGASYLAQRFSQALGVVSQQFARAREVVAVSRYTLDMLRLHFGVPASKGRVIYNGRPSEYFTPVNPVARTRLRAQLELPENATLCFTSARIDTDKGHQYQLEAIRQLHANSRLGTLHFAWAGEGVARSQLAAAVTANGLQKRIHLLGHRWDVPDWLNAADIFVLTTKHEALPLSVLEAMAKGLPIAATAVGGIPEELGNEGKLLPDPNTNPRGTVTELAKTLEQWSSDRALRKRIGQAEKQRAELMFREETMIEKTLALIDGAQKNHFVAPSPHPTLSVASA